eukprot:CAMPEP_0204903614 /NCGR_PEP_ID=MMETSP1397-20131031/4377_1 /ASSEMBLY_ACC=CAM_ASM_000891 /TAXON_ID=49980 /ORGANISM="Climacostomum Climacostomum virens, Strain Stock W-24" /LENGTH=223 /DNA_ID=CAMNT_0052072295 /DNA_START=2864 /DNA_END=3532 /DNA_ORIENTATION=-
MFLLLFGRLALAEVICPLILECSELDSPICLNATTNTVVINNTPCTNYGDSCSFADITDAIQKANESGEDQTIECQTDRFEEDSTYIDQFIDDICENQADYKKQRLKNGQPLFQCTSDDDCILENGETARCLCANLVAKSFCELSYGDDIMAPIFDAACRNDTRMFRYYFAFRMAYLSSLNPPRCSLSLFENIVYTSQIIQVGYDNDTRLTDTAAALGFTVIA